MISINVFMDIMYIHRRIARGGTWLNVGLSKVAKSLLHWSLQRQPAVYIMIQCTEPATPAVIVFCEFPVSLQKAVLGLKTPTSITVLLKRASFGSCKLSHSHTLKKSRSIEERPAQTIFRQTQTDASRLRLTDRQTVSLVDVTQSLDNNISPPKFISQDVGHGL